MSVIPYFITGVGAYLLGSIPTGFLVGKAKGIDIRTIGSGNIGATNVFRHLGKWAGAIVLLADALKGWLAVAVVSLWVANSFQVPLASQEREWLRLTAGVLAILGHNYTCWLRFRGGKGIATSAGVLLALVPISLLIIFIVWILVLAATRYVSLASICASFTLPFAAWLTRESTTIVTITAALAALAIYKHRSNIQRLLNGTESKIGRKPAPPSSSESLKTPP